MCFSEKLARLTSKWLWVRYSAMSAFLIIEINLICSLTNNEEGES